MLNIAVLVSGGGTNLQALLDANLQHGEIAFVLSNRKAAYALERARARGVETAVLSFCAGTAAFTAPLTAAFGPTRAKRLSEAFRCVLAFLRKEIRFACRIGFIQLCIGEWYEFRYRALIQAL